jgi:hypothetical protein
MTMSATHIDKPQAVLTLEYTTKFCPRAYFQACDASIRIADYVLHLEKEAWKCDGRPEVFSCTPCKFPSELRKRYRELKEAIAYLDGYACKIMNLTYVPNDDNWRQYTSDDGLYVLDETKFRHVTDDEVYDHVAEELVKMSLTL